MGGYMPQGNMGGGSSRGSVSTPSSDMPSNANYPGNNNSYTFNPQGPAPMSPPQLPGRRGSYQPPSSGPSHGPGSYVLSPTSQIPTITNQPPSVSSSPTTALNYGIDFQAPRTTSPFPLYVVTQGLHPSLPSLDPDSNPPGLLQPHEASPAWASSDSNFSTPSDISNRRSWARGYGSPASDWNNNYVTAYPATSQDMRSPGGGLETITAATSYLAHPFSPSPAYPQLMDMPMAYQDESNFLDHAHHSYSSVRSPTPPNISSSVQSAESLVTLAPALSEQVVGRYKDSAALLGPLSGAACPNVSLPRPIRNAIPDFLDVYWRRFDTLFPLVHRRVFETAPNDVLRCAMAAVATQFLDGKEDRIKGNQLHEFAWHEARRVSDNRGNPVPPRA
jgi:hypothetical protein